MSDEASLGKSFRYPDLNGTAAVAGLADEVETLARKVTELTTLPAQVDAIGTTFAQDITSIRAQLDQLWPAVAQLVRDAATAPKDTQGSPSWLGYDGDASGAEALLRDLSGWVGRVYLRYSDATQGLPACWMWHPDIIEELLWLRLTWTAAYDPRAPKTAVGDWHERHRVGVVKRIRDYSNSCAAAYHADTAKVDRRRKPGPVVVLEDAIPAVADWWVTERDKLPPEPTERQIRVADEHETSLRR